jgi:hypothetical protein
VSISFALLSTTVIFIFCGAVAARMSARVSSTHAVTHATEAEAVGLAPDPTEAGAELAPLTVPTDVPGAVIGELPSLAHPARSVEAPASMTATTAPT